MDVSRVNKHNWQSLWVAVVICVGLLILSLIPVINHTIQAIDFAAAKWFNRAAGMSPIIDRFVLLVSDDDGQERIAILVVVWFLIALVMSPTRLEKSRMLGTLLFAGAVIGPYFLIDSLLDDVFRRASPSFELQNLGIFNSLEKMYDKDADLTDKRSFPNMEAVILFTAGFLLLRLGRVKGALVALAVGMTAPLLRCVAGLTWMSDIYLGSLPVGFLLSAVAVETPFYRLYNFLVEMSAAGFDEAERFGRSLGPMWRHKKAYWTSQNVFHMEVVTKRFAQRELAHILDPHKQYEGEPVVLEVPLGGLRSVVRLARIGPVKAVLRAYPLSRRYDAEQHYKAATLLARHGIRVPQIYHRTESPKKYGALFLVEEFIEGCSKEPGQLTEENLRAAAVEMAKLHRVKNQVWGAIALPRTEEYGNVLLRRIERQLTQAERGPILKGQQENVARVRRWFNQWRTELNAQREFSLVHGYLHRENCIFETSGRFCLLDITTLEWGMAANDLVTVHYSQLGAQHELMRAFDEAYLAEVSPGDAELTRRLVPLFEGVYCLSQLAKYTKRLGRSQKRQVGDAISKGTHWWHQLLAIVELQPE